MIHVALVLVCFIVLKCFHGWVVHNLTIRYVNNTITFKQSNFKEFLDLKATVIRVELNLL